MKFVHMADMHFDSPFVTLAENGKFAQERRLEQRKVMKDIVEYIKKENIPYFFIAGDLYEQDYIRKSTIEYINSLFKEIENTKIFIVPGNHDPYIKNSFYQQYKWNSNVHIFTENIECVQDENVNIYGYGFNDFYMKKRCENIDIKDASKINILITHGNLDNGAEENKEYNPLNSKELKDLKLDYVALGHIHKTSYNDYENQKIVYPGSPVSIGFDELGKRGFIVGEIEETTRKLNIKFIETEAKTFEEKNMDVSEMNSEEELIEKINLEHFDEDKFYKLILVGKRKFEIKEDKVLNLIDINNVIKIRNKTEIKYDIEEVAMQQSLKGLFAKQILEKLQKSENVDESEKLLEAFEIGMEVLNK